MATSEPPAPSQPPSDQLGATGQPPSAPPPPPAVPQPSYSQPAPTGGYQTPGGAFPTAFARGGSGQYSGFGLRLGAFAIDIVILFIVDLIINVIFSDGAAFSESRVGSLIQLIIDYGYFAVCWSASSPLGAGQTIGNRLLGIRVAREDGTPLDIGSAIARSVLLLVTGILWGIGWTVSLITSLTTARHQALHDMPLNTTTVRA